MKPTSLVALSILLVTGCITDPGGSSPPPPDDCSAPRALDGIESIEVGVMQEGSGSFVPWEDEAMVELTFGLQGGTMLGVVLSLRGSNLPACMQHSMELRGGYGGGVLANTNYSVKTYAEGDGTRVTSTVWLIFDDSSYARQGDQLELTLHVGQLEVRRSLMVAVPIPVSMDIAGSGPLSAGSAYLLEIVFDRWIESDLSVAIESSDPALLRPLEPTLQVTAQGAGLPIVAELEAVASGGPVTIRVTANGHTIEREFTVD